MKKLSLLLIVLIRFVQIGFGQEANPNVKPGEGKGDGCQCGEKGINISTGFNNKSNSLFGNSAVDNEWKIVSYPNGTGSINAVASNPAHPLYALPSSTSEWLVPQNVSSGGSYTYQYTFNVPVGTEANLKFRRIGADDDLVMKIDGDQVFTSGNGGWAFKEDRALLKKCLVVNKLSSGTHLTAGTHTIECIVNNGSNGPTGLLLEGCYELVQTVPECRCPAGWYSNTDQKDGGVILGDDGCKKAVCNFEKSPTQPKNGTAIGDPAKPWGFTWENAFYVWGTKANGGAPICTLNGKPFELKHFPDSK
jgi:hypothetical protein